VRRRGRASAEWHHRPGVAAALILSLPRLIVVFLFNTLSIVAEPQAQIMMQMPLGRHQDAIRIVSNYFIIYDIKYDE
jgi:hypothetical protein